ncbi:MAG: hypothetical protein LBI09_02115 [Nitrososphaerota archaeon]|jgi:N-acetylneuraminic acid mutarotase|nr:hypothetical protein [Nitrososphaerota archaeon]
MIFSSVSASELMADSWNAKTPMNQARYDLGIIVVDGKIYAIGGQVTGYPDAFFHDRFNDSLVGTNERYDPATDAWVILEPMPTPRADFAIATYQGKIYCIGGAVGESRMYGMTQWWTAYITCGINEVYDTVTGRWSTINSLPVDGMNLKAHTINGQIFVIADSDLFMYDPVADLWAQKDSIPLLPRDVRCVASVVVNDKLIVTGEFSYEQSRFVYKFYIYDQKNDSWSEIEQERPSAMFGNVVAGTTMGHYATEKIYVIGLSGGGYVTMESNQVYDPFKNTWSVNKAMPIAQYGSGIAVVDDALYVIGGTLNEQYLPVGYDSTHITPEPSETNSPAEPYIRLRPILTCIIITALTFGIIAIVLYLYTKK